MALFPRRVKDLPKLELDSEDESKTPRKTNNGAASQSNEKQDANKENSMFASIGMYPKRRSELPPLESDSDSEDDQSKRNNLNCAILNDSFILSPCRSEQDEKTNSASKVGVSDNTDNLSFVSKFHKMALNSGKKPSAARKVDLNNDSLKPLQMIDENREDNNKGSAVRRVQSEPSERTNDLETPLKPFGNNNTSSNQCLTVATTVESQFITPQVRTFSVRRRPRELCISSASQKSRLAIANEFRSQKVLFQTPITIQRAAIPNDSLAISLCDTIPECIDVTSSAEKTSEKKKVSSSMENDHLAEKSKKSLEAVFQQIEDEKLQAKEMSQENRKIQENGFKNETEMERENEREKPKANENGSCSSYSSSATTNKDSVLHINNMDYKIIRKLGTGGSSSVYLAIKRDNGKEYALKVVDLQGDPLIVEGYLNETQLLAKLQGNPCVVALYDYQLLRKESRLFMVMEKGDSDLHKILQSYTTSLPLYVLMNFLYQMIQAVNYIHQNGVIHSDLKPANFLMVNGRLKLIDFGIASNIAIDSTSIIKYSQAGTFNYISPEALTDTSSGTSPMRNQPKIKISTKSDVWSLGCILYLFLYQKTPFSHIKQIYAKMAAISNPSTVIDYPSLASYYPVMLLHMVKNCLQHNPKQRPSCADLLKYPFHMIIPIQNLSVGNKT